MGAGRKRKPSHIHLVNGNPSKRAPNKREPKPARVPPTKPEHLDPLADRVWDKFSELTDRMGVLTEADGFALERLCELYAEILKLATVIVEQGRFYTTTNQAGDKMIRPHPAVAQLADADRRFRGYLTDFGLTPSARSSLQTTEEPGASDPAAAYF